MAIVRLKSLACAILLMCLVLSTTTMCEARGRGGGRGHAGGLIRRTGRRDPNEKVFNVLQFGAKPGGRKDSALAFIRAWRAACTWKGKARLLIPKGATFKLGETIFQGPCNGPIVVQIAGNLKAVTDLSVYTQDYWMLFEEINGLVVTGTGIVDGQGPAVWKFNGGPSGTALPASIKFINVVNGVIRQISSVNPMGFHLSIVLSQNIRARKLHLTAPDESPNTDGIHISQSNQIKVARSIIQTGDDCIGIIQGSTDISVKKVTCGPGHGISIGSLGKYQDEKDVKGVTVTNCTLKNTQNGVRIKTWGGSPPSQASDMTFSNIIMDGVLNPIIVDQLYGSKSRPSRVKISDIRFQNIRGTTISNNAVQLICSNQFPCERIQMSNINLKYTGISKKPFTSICANAKVTYAGFQFPPRCR